MNSQRRDTASAAEITQQGGVLSADSQHVTGPGELHPVTLSPSGRPEDADFNPESDEEVPVEAKELKNALLKAPPVNSSYLPLPWKGRLGYVSSPSYLVLYSIHS